MGVRRSLSLTGLVVVVLAGCGASSDSAQVRSVVERYAAASASHDYQTICDDLVAPVLASRVEQVGLPCELAFRHGLEGVVKPKVQVGTVRVIGSSAYARVHSTAANQAPSDDTMMLLRSEGRWRIAALSSRVPLPHPAPQPGAKPSPDAAPSVPPGAIPVR